MANQHDQRAFSHWFSEHWQKEQLQIYQPHANPKKEKYSRLFIYFDAFFVCRLLKDRGQTDSGEFVYLMMF